MNANLMGFAWADLRWTSRNRRYRTIAADGPILVVGNILLFEIFEQTP